MKWFAVILFVAGLSYTGTAQLQQMYTKVDSVASTSWTVIHKDNYRKIFQFELINDETGGSGELYIALSGSDTSATRRFAIKWGESLFMENVSIDNLALRASAGTIHYRLRYH